METKSKATITFKKGEFQFTVNRSELVEALETPDGVIFNFKNGVQLSFIDTFMPSATKQLVKAATDNFMDKSITFDLNNYRRPAVVNI